MKFFLVLFSFVVYAWAGNRVLGQYLEFREWREDYSGKNKSHIYQKFLLLCVFDAGIALAIFVSVLWFGLVLVLWGVGQ